MVGMYHLLTLALKNFLKASILGDYQKTGDNEYTAHLLIKENGQNLVDLKLSVPTEDIAQSICNNWQSNNEEIYQFLIGKLM